MELLSPAGDWRSMEAAIDHGADAVYLGYTAFGARGYAGNFDEEALRAAMEYCHLRGKRVYVTVNTLALPGELAGVEALLGLLNEIHADAAIVQDLGILRLACLAFPDLPLHASTQMGLTNAQGVAWARRMGLRRVVPARECRLSELRAMADAGVETEAFVHGALCASMSGQCLFSSMLGGRSGNRGRCAQPCRLPYDFAGEKGHFLSPRDLCLIDDLAALREAGVTSLKIEGRMKRPEYVAVVTALYRRRLDALKAGAAPADPEQDRYELRQAFHRGGFTRGFVFDTPDAKILDPTRPNHGGIPLGRVTGGRRGEAWVRLERALGDGDFLQLRGREDEDLTYHGENVQPGREVRLSTRKSFEPGDSLVRLTEAGQMDRFPKPPHAGQIPVSMDLFLNVGELPHLILTDGEHSVEVRGGEPVQAAQQRPLGREQAMEQLSRLGDTPFYLSELEYTPRGGFLPVSALNALRRQAVELLKAKRLARPEGRRFSLPEASLPRPGAPLLIAQGHRLSMLESCRQAGADLFYWQPEDYRLPALDAQLRDAAQDSLPLGFVMPQFCTTGQQEDLAAWLRKNLGRFAVLVAANPAQLSPEFGLPLISDAPLHVMNPRAAETLTGLGVRRMTLSPELNAGQIRQIAAMGGEFELLAYGRAQLMLLSFCPRRGMRELETCDLCEHSPLPPLNDRKGYSFPLRRQRVGEDCRLRLLNSLPTYVGRHMQGLAGLPVSLRAVFEDEEMETVARVLGALRGAMAAGRAEALPFETTGGHYGRGVL